MVDNIRLDKISLYFFFFLIYVARSWKSSLCFSFEKKDDRKIKGDSEL